MEAALTFAGLKARVVGRDATLMRGRTGFNTSYETNTLSFGAGESFDAIVTAPAFSGGTGSSGLGYDTYVLYNRAYTRGDNLVGDGGGQRTEIRVYPAGDAAGPAVPQPAPGRRRREAGDERSDDDETNHVLAGPRRARARGVVGDCRRRAAGGAGRRAGRRRHGGLERERHRLHDASPSHQPRRST